MGKSKISQPVNATDPSESICTSTGARFLLTPEQEEFLRPLIEHGLEIGSSESKVLFLSQLLVLNSGRVQCKVHLFDGAWARRIFDLVNEASK